MTDADPIEQLRQRQAHLLDQLAGAPLMEITGVVGARDATGSSLAGDAHWTLAFTCNAWRVGDAPIDTRPLTVRRRVSEDELAHFRGRLRADTIVRFKARAAIENALGTPQALLETIVGPVIDDQDLNRFLAQARQPISLDDAQFGMFTFDRSIGWFSATTRWGGQPITLNLVAENRIEAERALRTARELRHAQPSWQERIERFAVERLLALKNESWLGEDETPFDAARFGARMTLESISAYPDGSFEFWHDDGDLFWGHSILVRGNLADGPTDADIPG